MAIVLIKQNEEIKDIDLKKLWENYSYGKKNNYPEKNGVSMKKKWCILIIKRLPWKK
jgi:hypothetical protein